jgi:hypothetical protein
MEQSRRRFLETLAAASVASLWAGRSMSAETLRSQVKPRHVICFLGRERSLTRLSDAASRAINDFAADFTVDKTYSQDRPDDRMSRSFDVCWDRVEPNDWTLADEQAVASHQSVLYVLGPPMTPDIAVGVSATGLRVVERLIDAGAIAVKGESAGVAHGVARWRQLNLQAQNAARTGDDPMLSRTCRIAFAKRPLDDDRFFQSVGFHLVGLPEVYVARTDRSVPVVMDAVTTMDAIADEMKLRKLEDVLRDRRATLSFASDYAPDDFKFNPYGIVQVGPG